MNVTLARATSADEIQTVKHMFVAYFYDMSQYDDNMVINDYGLPMFVPPGAEKPVGPHIRRMYHVQLVDP